MWHAVFSKKRKNMSGKNISDYFSDEDFRMIAAATRSAEETTSGEIRVMVRMRCEDGFEGKLDEQAFRDFAAHSLANTRDKTGVLVLVVLSERQFKILADEGIHAKLPPEYWQQRAAEISELFRDGNYSAGICRAVVAIGGELARYFPRKFDDANELPDDVIAEEGA